MNMRFWTVLAAGGSVALLAGAFTFQAMGYAPCQMCHWQRWPHMAAIVIGVLTFIFGVRGLAYLGAVAAAITSGLGFFHAGVEHKWWDGPASCTGGGALDGLSGNDLLSLDGAKLVMCDEISWAMFGLSMPAWNGILSAVLVILWLKAARSSN
jgi:disulfide bond formation protein DsbB